MPAALLLALTLHAADAPYLPDDYKQVRDRGNKASLLVYTVFSVATLATGFAGFFTTQDHFWQGVHIAHLVWGGTNTVIAGICLYNAFKGDTETDPAKLLQDGKNAQLAYTINSLFDVATTVVSVVMLAELRDARWQGFAASSLVQSLFLLAYDASMAVYHGLNNERAR
ncbi:MAG: hypothetical protein JNK82_13100 [Myxococcaceae bacterium]|nr:hypothetical protein [Myxococcaceae bacterium]